MLLGQLFHYLKVIDSIKLPINSSNFSELELAGVKNLNFEDFKNLSQTELKRKLRDIFRQAYTNYLKESKLDFSYNFWLQLTSPKKSRKNLIKPTTNFQEKLLDWQQNDFSISELENLLKEGKLVIKEGDVAIFYGLKVINKLTEKTDSKSKLLGLIPQGGEKKQNLKKEPQILVLTKNHKNPLFINLNSLCIPFDSSLNEKEILNHIQTKIDEYSSISLVLVDLLDSQKIIHYLQKHLPSSILVTSLGLEEAITSSDNNQTFFDTIVRKTLGVRLN